jgi:hypothetical protein
MQLRRVWLVVGGLVAVALAVAAVSWTRLEAVAPVGDVARAGPQLPADQDQQVLATVGVQPGEVGPGLTVHLMDHGADLSEPTLDLCDIHFSSEAHRQARRQLEVDDSSGEPVFSTEAVLYQDQSGAAEAMAEVRGAPSRCGHGLALAHDVGAPSQPGVDRVAVTYQGTEAVYLRRGRLLLGLYFADPIGAQAQVGSASDIRDTVSRFAQRVAGLPASDLR